MDDSKNILEVKAIKASEYNSRQEYWDAVIMYLKELITEHTTVVIEDYTLYSTKCTAQINSEMETPRLLGIIEYMCWLSGTPTVFQKASYVKTRWSDQILLNNKILKKKGGAYYYIKNDVKLNSDHIRDALRHALHFMLVTNKNKTNYEKPITTFKNY